MRRMLKVGSAALPAVLAVLLGLGLIQWWETDAPPDEWARFAGATPVDGLVIVVERDRPRLRPGAPTTYTVATGNVGRQTAEVNIRAAVPPWLAPTDASAGRRTSRGYVEWPVTLAPGAITTHELTGAYARPEVATPGRVAFTACAIDEQGHPVVCATDVGHLQQPGADAVWWAVGSVLVLAGIAGTVAAVRSRRRLVLPAEP